jgi:hypothetical protein
MLEFQNDTRTNSQAKVQNEVNMHNQGRERLMQVAIQMALFSKTPK